VEVSICVGTLIGLNRKSVDSDLRERKQKAGVLTRRSELVKCFEMV
jgi:hypothetical protein